MRRNYQTIAIWVVLVVSLSSIVAVWNEGRRSRLSEGVELILQMEDQFDGDRMRQVRQDAATGIQNKQFGDSDDLLDFFETIGMLARRGAVDREMVWHAFYDSIHGYWQAAHEHIVEEQKMNPEAWKDLARLHQLLVVIENRKHGRPASDPDRWSADELKNFLEDEASLREDSDSEATGNPAPLLRQSGRTRL